MLIRQFEYLVALAREQHFARAAAACHVSQPALSAGIRKLESELGVPIVRRGHRFEGFTPEGERVLRWAARILADRDGLAADVDTVRAGHIGTLRVGVLPEAAAAFADVAAPFAARHPRVALTVRTMPATEIQHGLTDFTVDCGVIRVALSPARARGGKALLYRERAVLLTGDRDRFAGRTRLEWAELAHVPFCRLLPDPTWRHVREALAMTTGAEPEVRVAVDSPDALFAHLRAGGGCAVITHAWLRPTGVPEGLRAVPMAETAEPTGVGIVVAERHPEPVVAAELIAFARTVPLQARLDALPGLGAALGGEGDAAPVAGDGALMAGDGALAADDPAPAAGGAAPAQGGAGAVPGPRVSSGG
ncbi:LysR family transcriptional regulator [Streptomonospora sp. S1-112]|uniref:LysR family transcriptional regulator n=1 Tax=Streptomonospora mangrovi TaxID=2883123 RepID=A0A9X3SEG2_9ACTN|nr:LysR family transcriptional regulator [Streptomonospora mangrovi]MDA0563775.1 LysR family transcriptional regulator [Streptomonospora mangrovi]